MKKWIVLLLLLGGGGAALYWKWPALRPGATASATAGRPVTAAVITTNISFAVNAAGEIAPVEQVSVRPEINGKIELLPVDIGDTVKKGDLLFKLDDKELQQQRASSQTQIERAKLELGKAERDFQRAKELLDEQLVSQEVYDNTKTTFELAKNSLDRAQRDLLIIDERLTKTSVNAPFDCTVLTRPISAGQTVSGSGGFNSGTEVLTVADLNSMIINAHVNQADVPRLSAGQQVEVAVEAVAGLKVTGVVERIAPQATIRNNIKGFAARILLKNVDRRIRPGMTANVKIPVGVANNVVAVPLAAVFTELNKDTGQQERYVYVQRGTAFERRDVQIGLADFFYVEVQRGLQAGDVVSLELPKNIQEKSAKGLAGPPAGGNALAGPAASASPSASASASASPSASANTNTIPNASADVNRPAPVATVATSTAAGTGSGSGSGR